MKRRDAVSQSKRYDGTFGLETYRSLKKFYSLPDARPTKKVSISKSTPGRVMSDRERVAKIQLSKSNYTNLKK
jgi:hypothetical protein